MNLDPDQQTNFLDLMRPPVGYRLDAAVGTSYSLDFVSLTSLMLAFVDGEKEDGTGELNQIEVLHAISRLSDRVRVFLHQGRINTQADELKTYGRLSGMYDRIVRAVNQSQGSFHPKVWVLRFTPRVKAAAMGQQPFIRVVCSSRNLTTSSSWEIFAAMDGNEVANTTSTELGAEVAAFLRRLRREFPADAALLTPLAEATAHAVFPLPSSASSTPHFLWQWQGGDNLWKQFPVSGSHLLVVSPFVRTKFLSKLLAGYERLTLISTQDELDAMSDEFHSRLREQDELFIVRPARAEDDSEALQLHAKIYLAETASRRVMLLGSANASESAWHGNNCEAMVSLSPGLSIPRFLEQFIYGPVVHGERTIRCWIQRYQRQPVVEDESALLAKRLDAAHNAVARLSFSVDYLREQQVFRVSCPDYHNALPELQGVQLRLCPLTRFQRSSDLLPAEPLVDGHVEFSAVRIAEVTEFLLLELILPPVSPRYFVVQARSAFEELRADRFAAMLEEYVTPDSFRRFLHAILFGRVPRDIPTVPRGEDGGHRPPEPQRPGSFHLILGDATLEEVMLACTEDPDRIVEIDQLLATFQRATGAVDEHQRFLQFWGLFKSACATVRKEGA